MSNRKTVLSKKPKKPTPNTLRAFALTSLIGTALRVIETREVRLSMLFRQCNNALKVFHAKMGTVAYMNIANEVNDIWTDISESNSFLVDEDKLAVMVEMMLTVIPPAHVKLFLNTVPYKAPKAYHDKLSEEDNKNLEHFIESFSEKLNDKFGTKPYLYKETPIKPKKTKKERDKPKVKATPKPSLKSKGIPKKLKQKMKLEKELSFIKDRLTNAKMPFVIKSLTTKKQSLLILIEELTNNKKEK